MRGVIKIGSKIKYFGTAFTVEAIKWFPGDGQIPGERYYFLVDNGGGVAMLPASAVREE